MIAAITLMVLDPFGTGKLVLFQVTYDKVRSGSLTYVCFTLTHPFIGMARTRIVIFRDSRGFWSKINLKRVQRLTQSLTL